MASRDRAASLLKAGNSPREIATEMGISVASVEQYLYTKVGEGVIRRSDILFSIKQDTREAIEELIHHSHAVA